jgi:hypothetical protein
LDVDLNGSKTELAINVQNSKSLDEEEDGYEFAKELVVDFTKVLKEYLMYRVADESRLPYIKDELKTAIKLMIYYSENEGNKSAIRKIYYLLAKFQPDSITAENMQRICMKAYEKSFESNGLDLDEDRRLSGMMYARDNFLDNKYFDMVEAEEKILKNELLDFENSISE